MMNTPSDSRSLPDSAPAEAYRQRIGELEAQLAEAKETLDAIRDGEVDAVVVGTADRPRIFTLESADRPYRLLIEEMREGAVTLNAEGLVLYCNRALGELLGTEPERLVSKYFAPCVAAAGRGAFDALLRSGGKRELTLQAADGRTVQVLLSISSLSDGDERLMCGVVTDLTEATAHARDLGDVRERLAVAAARREGDERFRLIVESSTDYAIITIDLHERVTIWNSGAETILGWRADEILGKPAPMIWTPEDRRAGIPEFEMAKAWEAGRVEDERYHLRKDGSRFWANGLMMPLKGENGAKIGFLKILRDRTAQRELETARLELNEILEQKVAERTAELAATNERLQVEMVARARSEEALRHSQKIEAIGQLTGGVAHDFNNLLTIIRSSADLLRRQGISEEKKRRYIDAISDTSDRAAKLTSQLLAYARRQPLKPETFDVVARIRGTLDLLHATVGSLVRIETALDCEPCWVLADANQLETALLNLAVNARDAMKGEGALTIAVHPVKALPAVRGRETVKGAFVAVAVSDNGCGIAAHQLERIFEPFYTTKGVGKGTGLGLSQVFGFCKQSGGEVRVESEIDRGATFTLYLPRATNGANIAVPYSAPEIDTNGDELHGQILVVDADTRAAELAALRQLALEWMERMAQFPAARRRRGLGTGTATRLSDIYIPALLRRPEVGRDLADRPSCRLRAAHGDRLPRRAGGSASACMRRAARSARRLACTC